MPWNLTTAFFFFPLCGHEQAAIIFKPAVDQLHHDAVLDVFHVGAFAPDAPGSFGVGVFAQTAKLVHDVKSMEHLGVVCKAFPDADNKVFFFSVAFLKIAFPGEGVHVAIVNERIRIFFVIAVLCVLFGFLMLAALGIFAFFVKQAPSPDFGKVGFKGNLLARLIILDGLAEQHVGVACQAVAAFLGGASVEAEVGVHQVRLLGNGGGELVPVNFPKVVYCLFGGFCGRGCLDNRDEVADLGGCGLGLVETHKRPPFFWGCLPVGGRFQPKNKKRAP